MYVVNSLGEPVEWDEIGEVFIAGAHVASGYINGKEMVNNSFVANTVQVDRKGERLFWKKEDGNK